MGEEALIWLIGILVVAVVALLPIVTFILAMVLFRRVGRLQRRLAELERSPRATAPTTAESAKVPASAEADEEIAVAMLVAEDAPFAASASAAPALTPEIDSRRGLELVVGRKVLGWTAVLLMVLGMAFFLRYAIENQWIGPLGRVSAGIVGGLLLTLGAWRAHRNGQRVMTPMLNSAGVVVLYLSVYSAFGFYHLLPQQLASGFMLAVIIEAALLAVVYDSWALAIVSVVGGLMTPLLMHSERDQYQAFFSYLIALNIGVVLLTLWKPWRSVGTVSLLGTHMLFWLWYQSSYHPEKIAWTFGMQAALYVIFLLHGLAADWPRNRHANWHDLARLLLNAFLWFAAAYVLLRPEYRLWLGSFAVVMAAVYVAYARFILSRRPDEQGMLLAALAVAVGFIAFALPIQARASWVALGWAAEALALWWFGLRINSRALRSLAAPIAIMAVIRLLIFDTPRVVREPFIPLWNEYGTPAVGVAACLLFAAWIARRFNSNVRPSVPRDETVHRERAAYAGLSKLERVGASAVGVLGLLTLWIVLSVETADWFEVQSYQAAITPIPATTSVAADAAGAEVNVGQLAADRWLWFGQMALSALWGLYAMAILIIGFRVRSALLRWSALFLFALTTIKVLLWDMAGLHEIYRIMAFFIVAILLGLAGWAYQRVRVDATSESDSHEHS